MKKIFLILIFLLISNNVYANKILKSGFITKSAKVKEGFVVEDPKNKIIIIFNHGPDIMNGAMDLRKSR